MPLLNKQKRIHYIGFNDFWYTIFGILALAFINHYLFNNAVELVTIKLQLIAWSVTLFFTTSHWIILRLLLIFLRKKYPDFKDDKKRISLLILAIIGSVAFVHFFAGWLSSSFVNFLFDVHARHITSLKVLIPITIITAMIMAIYEIIYSHVRLEKSIREEEQAKQVMIQAQLDTLRNQAQPHFLFNSLNTLRDIIEQDPREEATDFVDNLSNVYRFILESGSTNLIAIEKELKFAKAYVSIQSERFGDNLQLHWNIPEDQLTAMIVPMSLQLLIENAIKHNIVSRAEPLIITVTIIDDYLVVRNKIQAKSTKVHSTKIGLKNIEQRYALISNKLPVIENDGIYFTVSLPLLKSSDQKKNYANTNH